MMHERWLRISGANIRYWEAGQGPPLLLLPSAAGRAAEYFELIPLLENIAHVFVLDYPGFGQSDALLNIKSCEDLAHFVDEWRMTLDLKSCDVAGFSMGGWLALLIALECPKAIKRLILIASAAGRNAEVPLMSPAGLSFKEILDLFYFRPEIKQKLAKQKLSLEEKKEIHRSSRAFDRLAAYEHLLPKLQNRLHEVTLPTLVLAALEDRVMPLYYQKQLHSGISNSQLTVVEACGHAMLAERPDEVAEIMITFLQSSRGISSVTK